jgi:hypothetical protein
MVAVSGTQPGATRGTFDEERFLREVLWPVKNFLVATDETYPVLIFFFVGNNPHYEGKVTVLLPEQNEGTVCPSYGAAEKHFHREIGLGRVLLNCFVDNEAEHYHHSIVQFMKNRGVEDPRILSPTQLIDLASELTRQVA